MFKDATDLFPMIPDAQNFYEDLYALVDVFPKQFTLRRQAKGMEDN